MQRIITHFLLVLGLLGTILVYSPGLHGPFIFDDGVNLISNQHLHFQTFSLSSLSEAALSTPNGVFRRPISMATFALNFYAERNTVTPFPLAFPFKVTNLGIHLLNGIMVFLLTNLLISSYRQSRLTDLPTNYSAWLALAVSTSFLLHPLNLTGVLYVVQRMASLAAFFTFAGLCFYVWGRARLCAGLRGGKVGILLGLLIFMPLAVLSKENGLLLPFFMLALELIIYRFQTAHSNDKRFLLAFFVLCTALPTIAALSYLTLHPEWITSVYIKRDFTLSERLMTEARAIWFYLRLIVLPSNALMGVYHDDFSPSHGILDPASTALSIFGVLGLLMSIWALRKRAPLVAFGVLFFLVGHSMESSVVGLELVHEHRNYLPIYGIFLAGFHLLLAPFRIGTAAFPRRAVAALLIALFAFDTFARANSWASAETLWSSEVEHHPRSTHANMEMGELYANALTLDPIAKAAYYPLARHYFEIEAGLKKENINGLVGLILLSETYKKPIEKSWLDELVQRLGHEVLPSNTNDRLAALANCRTKANCPLGESDIENLLNAPLNNPKIVGRDKALIYSALTYYLFNIKHDYIAALASTRNAIALDGQDIDQRLWLINILIALQRQTEAREQIALLKQLDSRGARSKDVALSEERLVQDR